MKKKTRKAAGRAAAAPLVLIIMGSETDMPVMIEAVRILRLADVPYEMKILSAHRTPELLFTQLKKSEIMGVQIVIAGAGMAAHLAGSVASRTVLPVIGVPTGGGALAGVDSLLSTVQMPRGIPVATTAVGKSGAVNAGLLAVEILALSRPELRRTLIRMRKDNAASIVEKNALLAKLGPEGFLKTL